MTSSPRTRRRPPPLARSLPTLGALAQRALILATTLALACAAACAPAAPATPQASAASAAQPAASGPRELAVSFPILADIARNIAGDTFTVWSVVPDGNDAHTYDATAQDLARTGRAAAFVSIGVTYEGFLEAGGVRDVLRDRAIPHLILAENVDLIRVDKIIDHGDHVDDLREGDPHFWLDPRRTMSVTTAIAAFLGELDPPNATTFVQRAQAYNAELATLDAELASSFTAIPPERRKLVVFHDAFAYFSQRYAFEVVEVVIKAPGREPSAQEVAALRRTIEASGVPAVFKEPQFDARILDRVADDLKLPVGTLMTDTFTRETTTYVDLMRFNRDSLLRHLTPAR